MPSDKFNPSFSRILVTFGIFTLGLALAGCPPAFNYHPQDPHPDNEGFVSPTPTLTPVPSKKRVFVSSMGYNGDLGGLAGADQKCAQRASAAGLGGVWMAWISAYPGPTDAINRINDVGPWYLVNQTTKVFDSKSGPVPSLITNPAVAIDMNENGTPGIAADVWTGTITSGTAAPSTATCTDWTIGTGTANGRIGKSDIPASWTDNATNPTCDTLRRIYCFEQ